MSKATGGWLVVLVLALLPREEVAAQGSLPAYCSDGTYTCTAVDTTRWKYSVAYAPYGIVINDWFDTKKGAVDALKSAYASAASRT
jgi:hypothetical protein